MANKREPSWHSNRSATVPPHSPRTNNPFDTAPQHQSSTPKWVDDYDPNERATYVAIRKQVVRPAARTRRPERVLLAWYDRWAYHVRVYSDVLIIQRPAATGVYRLSRVLGAERRFTTVDVLLANGERIRIVCGFNRGAARRIQAALNS